MTEEEGTVSGALDVAVDALGRGLVRYRGTDDRLYKRDFAGELMERYQLRLVDYGFTYRRDNYFPQDDTTWFLLEK